MNLRLFRTAWSKANRAIMSGTGITRIELLTKENFDTWQIQVEALLTKNDTWGYVSGELPAPSVTAGDPSSNASLATWKAMDKKARSDIILSISPSELKTIKHCETSREIWLKLETIHASKGPARKATLLKQLTLHKMQEGEDVRAHMDSYFDTVDKLAAMNVEINQDLLSILMLQSLPAGYENFRCAMETRDELPDPEALKVKIIEECEARKQKFKENEGDALLAGGANLRRWNKNKPPQKYEGKDHQADRSIIKCFKCNKMGHKANECRRRSYRPNSTNNVEENYYFAEEKMEEANHAWATDSKGRWCIDSGCTAHMCNESVNIQNSEQCDRKLNLANKTQTTASMKGRVKILATDGTNTKTVNLNNTLMVPDLRTNLMSVAKITDNDREILFRKRDAIVMDTTGETKMVATRIGDLYFLKEPEEHVQAISTSTKNEFTNDSADLWHRRLGHLHMQALNDIQAKGLASGIKFSKGSDAHSCDVCHRGKLTAKPFKEREERSAALLEIIHSDVSGPMRVDSEGGSRFYITFTDDCSGWCEVYFLKSKSEVFKAFREYKNLVEKQTGCKIKNFQSDNGREYCQNQFDEFLKAEGIRRRLTAPYTPQQNGVAERKNRTLADMSRCLMIQSGLPPSFWAEATATANYIRNRCPSRSIEGKTPFEKWYGKIPNIKHLKIFGAKAFVLDKRPGKGKFDERSLEGRFVGYSDKAKAYRIRLKNSKTVLTTRDVTFDEKGLIYQKQEEPENRWYETENEKDNKLYRNSGSPEKVIEKIEENSELAPGWTEIGPNAASTQNSIENFKRARGRPKIVRDGSRGRPRKEYRCTSASSQGSQQQNSEEVEDEVFETAETGTRGEKRSLDSSIIQVEKRTKINPNNEEHREEHQEEHQDEPGLHDSYISLLEELAFTADVQIKEALNSSDAEEWKLAIAEEVRSHLEHGTWEIVQSTPGQRVIGSRTVLRNKLNQNGEIERRKARIVAQGFSQRPGFDFNETFAPVARLESVRLMMALAVELQIEIQQLDVTSAYLHGKIEEELYMKPPEMLEESLKQILRTERRDSEVHKRAITMLEAMAKTDQVCRLRKAIYGLKQSGRQWYNKLTKILEKSGLQPTHSDPCVFFARHGDKITVLTVYVDDMLLMSNDEKRLNSVKEALQDKLKIKDLGKARYCLGIEIHQGEEIAINQQKYIYEVLERFRMTECNPNNTPSSPNTKHTETTIEGDETAKNLPYRELVGSLMYLAVATRPDIAHTVSSLSQFNENPSHIHWVAAKRVLRYLKGTANYSLVYRRPIGLMEGYVDADWAGCPKDRRSYTGYVYKLGGAAISWKSQKQKTVALSSTEAEYMALSEATKEAIFLKRFMKELGFDHLYDGTIFCDNLGAKLLSKNSISHSRLKHIDIRHHFVRNAVREGEISVVHVPTEKMTADILTKSLNVTKHTQCTSELGLLDL